MKVKPILLAIMLAMPLTANAAPPSDRLLDAICAVESNGNANAIGDNGKAVGAYQIHPAVVTDVNRLTGSRYTIADRTDPAKARAMCRAYLTHYGERAGGTDEAHARTWNGGPKGAKKAATVGYWKRVKAKLEGGRE